MVQVSKKKFYECAQKAVASEGRGATVIHGNSGRRGRVGGGVVDLCCGFLRDWVETYCQVDGGGRLLWPQGMSIKDVYETTFQDWLSQQNPTASTLAPPAVSLSSFRSALAEPEFAHVLMRKEHNHTRCDRYTAPSFACHCFLTLRADALPFGNKRGLVSGPLRTSSSTWRTREHTLRWWKISGGSRSFGWVSHGTPPTRCTCSCTTTRQPSPYRTRSCHGSSKT